MASESFISVRGEAVLEVEPEIAAISVTVMARDSDRRRATSRLADRTAQVAGLIKGYGDSVEQFDSHPVIVSPEFKEGKPRERITGYVANAGFSAKVSDFTAAGELIARLAAEDMVTVSGPVWLLRPGSPAYRQARLAAAQDAVQRARDYAGAFGGQLTGLAEVADTGLLTQPREQPVRGTALMAARAAMAPEPEEFDFEPAKQVVRAQIEARFTMTPPAFAED